MSGPYNPNFSPAAPQMRTIPDVDSQYLSELHAEHQKLGPFLQALPICSRLLNQEIFRVSGIMSIQTPMAASNLMPNVSGSWNSLPQQRLIGPPVMAMDWRGALVSPSYMVKRTLCLEFPVDTEPYFNFIERILGPGENSLKHVEAATGCRVYIQGKGSMKDPDKEAKLRVIPEYEHLYDPLHILIEAHFPVNIVDTKIRQAQEIIEELLKPVRDQTRELATLKSNFREDSSGPSDGVSKPIAGNQK